MLFDSDENDLCLPSATPNLLSMYQARLRTSCFFFFLSLIASVFYIIIIWQVLSQIVSLVSKWWRHASSLWSLDTLQHPFCGENADDHLPWHRTHDFQRFSVDCGSVGLTCVWEVCEDLWVYCWMYRAMCFNIQCHSNTGVYTELYCTLMLLLQKQIQSFLKHHLV